MLAYWRIIPLVSLDNNYNNNFMETTVQNEVGIKKNVLVIGSFLLSAYWVIAIWGFWSNFIYSLGFNMSVFILGLLALFFYTKRTNTLQQDYFWAFPVVLIAVSFSLWENPFLKTINLFFLPFILSIFFAYSLSIKKRMNMGFIFLSILERILLITKLKAAFQLIFSRFNIVEKTKFKMTIRIITGILIFLFLAFTVFIPLLSSADPTFAKLVKDLMDSFYEIISIQYVVRLFFSLFFAIFILSYFLSFDKLEVAKETADQEVKLFDPIISGIVLGGIMFLYIAFLMTQLSNLWINQLPYNFQETEILVKSGFWQLFILSVINIIFFFGYFKKTNNVVQNILKMFTIASFLLLISAGHRMLLYVFYYGLSYEKFFALYTVIYCALVFSWLTYQLFANKNGDLFKFLIFSLLWMYSIMTVAPVERIIFSTNAKLSARSDSRIKLYELQMLSYDALPLVVSYRNDETWQNDWCYWGNTQLTALKEKKWYEKNYSNFSLSNVPKNWKEGNCENEESEVGELEKNIPTDTRQTYRSEDYAFEVKYPIDADWKTSSFFSADFYKSVGVRLHNNSRFGDVSIIPVEDNSKGYLNDKSTVSKIKLENFEGTSVVVKQKDGGDAMIIRLSSFPASWNKDNTIIIKYNEETEKEVLEILNSIHFL